MHNRRMNFVIGLVLLVPVIWLLYQFSKNASPTARALGSAPPTNVAVEGGLSAQIVSGQLYLPAQSKFGDCHVHDKLPDSACTPGEVNPEATLEKLKDPEWIKAARDVSEKTKQEIYREYGITEHHKGEYEIDHLIPIELGGSNNKANLWPELAEPRPGFHEKDELENYFHGVVKKGYLSLAGAQFVFATNWYSAWQEQHQTKH